MKKSAIILAKANKYMLQAEAMLRDDMAKRIMYSVIPSLAKDSEVYHTGGVVDYKALAAAIEGRHDIIKYGARACVQELKHYKEAFVIYHDTVEALKNADYKKIFEISIKCFNDVKKWDPNYGGDAWKKIAETLLRITQLDENLKQLRANKRSLPDFYDQEVEIMKQIVIYLNVFDGLSHNTSSILKNILNEEEREYHIEETILPFKEIENLLDAKELKDPIDVFKQIYPTLKGSGDINRYKDWFNKIKLNKKYQQNNDESKKDLFIIRLRKTLNPHIIAFNKDKEKLETSLNKLEVDNNPDLFNYEKNFSDSAYRIAGIKYIVGAFFVYYFENYSDKESQIKYQSITDHIIEKLSLFNNKAELLIKESDNIDLSDESTTEKEKLKNLIKKLIELVKNVLIYLEAI